MMITMITVKTWINVTEHDIQQLQRIDTALVRQTLQAGAKCPIPAIFLEAGAVPVKYVVIGRRIVFLHYILSRPRSDLLSQVFFAQLENPVKNDWSEQVKDDLKKTDLDHLTFDDIKTMKRNTFKKRQRENKKSSSEELTY